jgi:serine/threonine protein kinase
LLPVIKLLAIRVIDFTKPPACRRCSSGTAGKPAAIWALRLLAAPHGEHYDLLVPISPRDWGRMKIASIGPFEILAHLGEGAGSRVLHVRRAADGKEYALKLVPIACEKDMKYLVQARQEYRANRLLDHPNIVKVYRFEKDVGWLRRVKRAMILMEFIPGQTLDQEPPPGVAPLIRAFQHVASAVAHMHARGVVHADLKPNNIMVGPHGTKVIDLGLSRVNGESPGRLQGTPEYMAPETAARKLVNERSDVFNFGATMYRMLTFRYPPAPLQGVVLGARSFRRLLRPVGELNPHVPAELCELIHRCLSYEPTDRPAAMAEVQVVLKRLADAEGVCGTG